MEAPEVRIPSQREVAWRIRAMNPGQYTLNVDVDDQEMEKRCGLEMIGVQLWPYGRVLSLPHFSIRASP